MAEALRFEYVTERGEVVYGRPLSPYVRRGILEMAADKYPDVDVEPFVGEVDETTGLSAEHSQALARDAAYASKPYREAQRQLENNRWHHIYAATLHAGAVVDTPEGRERTIARYAAERERVRKVVKDPIQDDWLATVVYCLIVNYTDAGRIYAGAFQQISDEAMQAAVKFFRLPV